MGRARLDPSELLERRATTVLLVVSATLSLARFAGIELAGLLPSFPAYQREPWRLVTSTWLHVNVLHLIFNLYWLALLGPPVERALGTVRMAALLLLLALASSAAQVAFFDGGIGLSGIVYGLFGFLWVAQHTDRRFQDVLDRQTAVLFVAWFFLCIVTTINGSMRVANGAHAGGAVTGALVGWTASASGRARLARALPLVTLLGLLALACTLGRPYVRSRASVAHESAFSGWEALEAGDDERAARLLARAVDAAPDDCHSWWNLGVALWRLERFEEGRDAFERSAALCDPPEEHRRFLEEVRTFLARRAAGGDEVRRGGTVKPARTTGPDPGALNQQAFVLEQTGAVSEAIQLYERAAREGANDGWAEQRLKALKEMTKSR